VLPPLGNDFWTGNTAKMGYHYTPIYSCHPVASGWVVDTGDNQAGRRPTRKPAASNDPPSRPPFALARQ